MRRLFPCLALMLAACFSGLSLAADPSLLIEDPYVRLAPPNAPTTGAFMVIRNSGQTDRKLIKAESPAAKTVELHNHINENGIMKMRQIREIDVKANGQAELKPGSYHLMLIGMRKPLNEGESVPITLNFDDGGTMQVNAPVRKIEAIPHGDQPMSHGGMKH